MATAQGSGERGRVREERSRRAVAAALAVARDHGVDAREPTVLADYFSVMVHLRPAPVVARVSTWTSQVRTPIADWLRREIDMTAHLSTQGAPVVAPSGELPPGPHERDGLAISFWNYVEPDPEREVTFADCASMLVDLHAAMRTFPGDLPVLAPAANDIARGLDALDGAGDLIDADEAASLRGAVDEMRPLFERPPGYLQPLHGDVHPGNMIGTRDGPVWIDFEDVCLGPAEWDLSLLRWFDADTTAAHHAPDPEQVSRFSRLRALHLAMCLVAFRESFGDIEGYDADLRRMVDMVTTGRTTLEL